MITARYAREIPQRYRLEASRCAQCATVSFPPRLVCPTCKGRTFSTITLQNEGKLLSYTVVRVGSDKFSKETPFAVGIIELKDGIRITTQIADANLEKLAHGQTVRLVFRKIQEDGKAGILCYGYKAIVV
ncbi:MAG: Zn-ribbon domain-containing OB-fold protein [Ignavibacteria bacterium]|nr:Zn-ribbon domain-containing OB-fold protein [Ignavibacteria bacterium]